MKKLTTVIASIALIGTPAVAADIAAKAPPPSPAPVYNWTGWYAGVNVGASFGTTKTDFNVSPLFGNNGPLFQLTPGLGFSDQTYPAAFIGGGQIGYNWQYSPVIVVGLEADFQGSTERETTNLTQPISAFPPSTSLPGGAAVRDYTTQIDWFGTVRPRIGYVWGDGTVFSYVTGGLAYGEVKINGTNSVSLILTSSPMGAGLLSVTRTFEHSNVNTGWVVGTGTEGKLLIPGWTYKIEGLYMDLGTLDASSPGGIFGTFSNAVTSGGQVTTHTHFTDTILRVGLNYQFH
jgi:outer membrane immunogenic protein